MNLYSIILVDDEEEVSSSTFTGVRIYSVTLSLIAFCAYSKSS